MNDHGNVENVFERLDWNANQNNTVHLDLSASRSWAQTPNQYDQQAIGQDQRNEIKSFNTSAFWTHIFNPSALLSSNIYLRQDQVHYYPSGNLFSDQPATLQQARRLTNLGLKEDFTYSKGIQNLKVGANIYQTPLTEDFRLGITDPRTTRHASAQAVHRSPIQPICIAQAQAKRRIRPFGSAYCRMT